MTAKQCRGPFGPLLRNCLRAKGRRAPQTTPTKVKLARDKNCIIMINDRNFSYLHIYIYVFPRHGTLILGKKGYNKLIALAIGVTH